MITRKKAILLRKIIEKAAISLSDTDALAAIELYPSWQVGVDYIVDERIRYDNVLYRVVQAHTSQNGWEPPMVPALFTPVALPGEIPVWAQPSGAQDAYQTGDKVWYPDKQGSIYISIVDNNVWQPGVYGWDLV